MTEAELRQELRRLDIEIASLQQQKHGALARGDYTTGRALMDETTALARQRAKLLGFQDPVSVAGTDGKVI
jgi:Zn-dependent oligopeptidase